MRKETLGSQRFRRALKATGADLLDAPLSYGSFYCHAEIAQGGQGTVFLGTGDIEALSRVCVIKTFSESDTDTIDRAWRSIRIQLGLLDQASVCPHPLYPRDDQIRPTPWVPDILAWDLKSEVPWVAQDFRGPNLRGYLANGFGPETDPGDRNHSASDLVTDRLMSQIAFAVEFVHMQGVVHRDLKPDNILVEQIDWSHMLFESIALCDFDLSRSRRHTTLTQSAVGMGTRGYSAPEQLLLGARDVTTASDVYAVGMLAVFLYTGKEPRQAMVGADPTKLKLDPSAAERLGNKREWVEQALSFHPEERPRLEALGRTFYGRDGRRRRP
ncbi:MAG: protein kinase [Acidimicrobiales bacterium]|nr:protein kinase [Acidimicrobiales bacterium]